MEDFSKLFRHDGIDAGLAASIFHFKEISISDLKKYLRNEGIEVRLWNVEDLIWMWKNSYLMKRVLSLQ